MTSVLPSLRWVVPSLAATTPEPACGLPLVVSGGQMLAHAPKHVLADDLSCSNRYSVRPLASTSAGPRLVLRTATAAPPEPVDVDAGLLPAPP